MNKKNSNHLSFKEIINLIKKRNFFPVYILMGEEDYYIDEITKLLENEVLSEEEKDFNLITYYGADTEINKVIASSQQYPVMAEKQLVLLKEAQTMYNSKNQLDKLAPYLNHPNPSTILVITYKGDSLNATSSLMKAAKGEYTIIFKSERIKDYQLSYPLIEYCSSKGVKIDDKAVNLLCDYIGGPLNKLFGEVNKLILSKNNLKEITAEIIERNVGISKDYNTYELIKTISVKNYFQSMVIIEYFSKNPKQNPFLMVIATLFNYFTKLLIGAKSKDKTDNGLMKELELRSSFNLKDYKFGLRNFSISQIINIIHYIRKADAKSKGIDSNQNEFDILKELIFKIFTTQ